MVAHVLNFAIHTAGDESGLMEIRDGFTGGTSSVFDIIQKHITCVLCAICRCRFTLFGNKTETFMA